MSKEKIEEMANYIDKSHWRIEQDFTGCHINSSEIAEYLYKQGYHKQSEVAQDALLDLKRQIHDKAVYPHLSGISPYISLKVFDAILNNTIKKYSEDKK